MLAAPWRCNRKELLGPSALLILRGVGHNDVFRKALEPVARETILWLDRWLDRDHTSDRKDFP